MRISGSRVAHEAGETRVLVLTELASHSLLKSSATTPRPERRPRAPVRRRATGVHIAMGFAFYLADVMSILTADSEPGGEKRRRYVLVRSDHVAADMDWVRAWAGLPPAMGAFPHARSTYPAHNRTELSTAGRASLKAHLRADYDVLARLQQYALDATLIAPLNGLNRTELRRGVNVKRGATRVR